MTYDSIYAIQFGLRGTFQHKTSEKIEILRNLIALGTCTIRAFEDMLLP